MGRKAFLALALATLAGCGRTDSIVVGSKNFTEQLILGEIVAQHLESRLGVEVKRKLNLGGTLVAHQALVNGEIDLYPEYTGTALTAVLKQSPSLAAEDVLRTVRERYREWNIEWLDPLGFNNTFAMVVRRDLAEMESIRTLTDAAKREWTLGVGYEFAQRPDGLEGMKKTYSLPLARTPFTMDLGLLYEALDSGRINMAAGSSTDAQLASERFTVLADDRHYFPPYEAAVAARSSILTPAVRTALSELAGTITDKAMRGMNAEMTLKKRSAFDVAKEFLAHKGLR